jgi:hypothetical protein
VVRRHPLVTLTLALSLVALAVFGVVWFEPQALFIDERVEESIPSASAAGPPTHAPDATQPPGPASPATPAAGEPLVLASGEFRSLAHSGSGRALVLELDDGTRYLRFEDLDVENGPDLRVYLSPASADGPASDLGSDPLDLGPLKGNQGDQNYELPAHVDVSAYRSAVVWCRRFSVGFAVAPLIEQAP